MKNLALALAMSLLLAACSSGSTVAPLEVSLSGTFSGTFENSDGNQSGSATFNLSQAAGTTDLTGNAIFTTTTTNTCLLNGTVTGTNNGSNASITREDSNFQLAISDNGNTLSGTYVTTPDPATCSNNSGAGTITLTRS